NLNRVLAWYIGNLGKDAPEVQICRSNLATVLQVLGGKNNLLEAKELLDLAIQSDIITFGEESPEVTMSRSNLVDVLRKLGDKNNLSQSKEIMENSIDSGILHFN